VHVKKVWKIKPTTTPLALQIAREGDLTPLQAQLLINRGILDPGQAESFLRPRLADMADPMLLKDMADAAQTIIESVEKNERITIYGDYDADGLTATALLLNFFSSIRIPASYYIPNRLAEGYGLNREAIKKIAGKGPGVIVTVDCGTSNGKEIAFAKSLGMKVVVTDHHQVPAGFEGICPVVNPHRPDCISLFKDFAGVGLAFFLAVAIRAGLRQRGWFEKMPEPDLKEYLDLVALGTVADKVSLLDQNRILVRGGMGCMAKSRWAGIEAMKKTANLSDSEITAADLAFRLAPRLNAPGRMGDSEIGIKILTIEDPVLAGDLAQRINTENSRRQGVEQHILNQIEEMIRAKDGIGDRRSILIGSEGWHHGVLGIVASRLVNKYHRPTLLFDIQDCLAVGSGRSIDGFDIYKALSRLGHLFEKFGGHTHAAGFVIKTANIEILERELEGLAREILKDHDLVPTIDVDAEISLRDIIPETVRQIKALSPFGEGNPEPLFYTGFVEVLETQVVGERHLKLRVRQGGKTFDAIVFGRSDRLSIKGMTIDMVFTPELNRWQGYERIQLRIIDLKRTGSASRVTQ
jgi:single-stranded-DNA-specific exonuclease